MIKEGQNITFDLLPEKKLHLPKVYREAGETNRPADSIVKLGFVLDRRARSSLSEEDQIGEENVLQVKTSIKHHQTCLSA